MYGICVVKMIVKCNHDLTEFSYAYYAGVCVHASIFIFGILMSTRPSFGIVLYNVFLFERWRC